MGFLNQRTWAILAAVSTQAGISSGAADAQALRTYHIGNSQTWDSRPSQLPEFGSQIGLTWETGYHIKCSSGLVNITSNPDSTCVRPTADGRYQQALSEGDWDALVVQAYSSQGGYTETLGNNTEIIADLIGTARADGRNPELRTYLYTGYPAITRPISPAGQFAERWLAPSDDDADTEIERTRATFDHLLGRVRAAVDSEVFVVPVGEVLLRAEALIDAGEASFADNLGEDLYRDPVTSSVHLSEAVGRLLAAYTVMATVSGQPTHGIGGPDQAPLHDLVWATVNDFAAITGVPEPSTALLGIGGVVMLLRRSSRSR